MATQRVFFLLLSSLPFVAHSQGLTPVTMTLSATPSPSAFGAPVILSAAVTPTAASGRVTFYDGASMLGIRPLLSGTAALSTILLPAGTRKLTARYNGDATYAAGSAAFTVTVNTTPAVGFRTAAGVAAGAGPLASVVVGDFNGDGKIDFAAGGSAPDGGIHVLLGKGDGSFQAPLNLSPGLTPTGMAIGDFNNDGIPDLVVSGYTVTSANVIVLLPGNGDGTFGSPIAVPGNGVPQVADFNGDGNADLAIQSFGQISILLGHGDGTFRPPQIVGTSGGQQLAIADFNGDGKLDLVAGGFGLQLLRGNGDGTFQSPVNLAGATNPAQSIRVGDLNGDGKADIVVGGDSLTVVRGNGDGTFQPPDSYAFPGTAVIGDFNGDAIPDLAVASSLNGGTVYVLQGSGDGTFHLVLSYGTIGAPLGLTVAEFNGDGRADLIALDNPAPSAGNNVNILLGTTSGIILTAIGGGLQSGLLRTAFSLPLQASVIEDGSPVNGAVVTFSAPAGGASASLSTTTAVTNTAGTATVNAIANGTTGAYVVTATYRGLTASFSLANATVGSIVVVSGAPQSTLVNSQFSQPLQVKVTDSLGNPAGGAVVGFAAPVTGASAMLQNSVTTDAFGMAKVSVVANGVGGTYQVVASTGGASTSFSLTNNGIASIVVTSGAGQSAVIGTAFPVATSVLVKDTAGAPIPNIPVLFSGPPSGAGLTVSVRPFTDSTGVATAMLTSNGVTGSYQVTATVDVNSSSSPSTTFTLTNLSATAGGTNLALGKPASQSSTATASPGAVAGLAVDGNTDGNFANGSVTLTNGDSSVWWQVDLGSSAAINYILIWNRTDCCNSALNVFNVMVSDSPFSPSDSPFSLQGRPGVFVSQQQFFQATISPLLTLSLTNVHGRYVRVQSAFSGIPLSLAEVQVFGTPAAAAPILQPGVFRNGSWFLDFNGNHQWDATDAAHTFSFGLPGDIPVMGDWNGDGRKKAGIFRNGVWFVDYNGNNQWDSTDAAHIFYFGLPGDLPVMGDWNGDGRMKAGVFRNGAWFVDYNGNQQWDATDAAHIFYFGLPGDLPVMGDWNGDGRLKAGVFRSGAWFVDYNGNQQWDATDAAHTFNFGLPGDLPVMGDWNGDGTLKAGVYRNGAWFVDFNGNRQFDSTDAAHVFSFGLAGDLPVLGLWN